jgi:hypothetical protein
MRLALRTLFLTLLTAGSAALTARASNMPVFRHALERWPASDYELVVFHRGEMAPPEQAMVDRLRIAPGQSSANVAVRMVDVSGQMEEAMADLWTCQTNPQPPWVVVRAPETSADSSPVWAGRLTAAVADALLDSPARRKIVGHLLRGATAVWVLLESGEPMRDEAAVDVLSAELKRLEQSLKVPAAGDVRSRSPLPLAVEFALVRITRSDPAEEFLVTMLQHGKALFPARPVAFPIFGRGRTPGALVGREIEAESIGQACASIVGACVAETKEQHPGRDLLLAANWDTIFNADGARRAGVVAARAPVAAVASPASTPLESRTGVGPWLWLGGFVVVVAGGVTVMFRRRPGRGAN